MGVTWWPVRGFPTYRVPCNFLEIPTVTLPNRISLARLSLIPVFVGLLQLYTSEQPVFRIAALAVFLIAVASDGIDGLIARRYRLQTRLGAVLDPLADKLLINVAFVFLAVNQHLETPVPKWIPVIVLARDAFITGGAFLIKEVRGEVKIQPRVLGKITTVLQSVAIVGVLLEVSFAYELLMVMLIFTLASWADYLVQGLRQSRPEVQSG